MIRRGNRMTQWKNTKDNKWKDTKDNKWQDTKRQKIEPSINSLESKVGYLADSIKSLQVEISKLVKVIGTVAEVLGKKEK